VDGIFLLDKPPGLGSNDAVQILKRVYRARKAGHTGSLDVPATGLLPICLGEATKVSGYLLDAPKRYRAVIRFGVRTTTGDAQGEVVESKPVADLQAGQVRAALATFIGESEQIPPMYSAIKVNGRPLYELAYAGQYVERRPRRIRIFAIELIRFADARAEVEVCCSKGTYIRALAEDVGARLGCGGSLCALRRIGVGDYSIEHAHGLAALHAVAEQGDAALDRLLLAPDSAVAHLGAVHLPEDAVRCVRLGRAVSIPGSSAPGLVRLYGPRGVFLGVGTVLEQGQVAPRRLMNPAA
jgi:tRNA pseudouridine55 synthase